MDEATDDLNTGIIDISSANRRVWLVKVPDYLAERLEQLDEDGLDLGVVRATPSNIPNQPADVKLLLNSQGPCGDLPQEYTLHLSKCDQNMHIFGEDLAGHALLVEGRVEQDCQLKPILNDQYREVMRQRNDVANRPRRTVQMVDVVEERIRMGVLPTISEAEMLARRKRRYEPEQRKERLPKDEVMDMLFRAFEQTPHWSFKSLIDHTHQPSAFLKEILNDIAIYNTRGPYKGLYELKAEYKNAF